MNGLAGAPFLVTGGASGIGRAICERLAAEGAAVAIVDRNAELAEEVAHALSDAAARVLPIVADASREDDVRAAVERAARELNGLRGLATSAAIFHAGDMQPLVDVTLETFQQVLSVNLTGTFLFAKYSLPHFLVADRSGRSWGSIVTIASTAGLRGHGFGSGYTASKGGVIALTRLLAFQYGERGVRTNCVCPGATRTPMSASAYDQPDVAASVARGIPLRRIASPDEIGNLACYLLSTPVHKFGNVFRSS